MRLIFGVLAGAAGIYSLLIFIRIILSWFSGAQYGKPLEILNQITDPYLDWWRRNLKIRLGFLDFSVIAAMVSLYALQRIFSMLAVSQRAGLGGLLAVILSSLWSFISFIIGFCMVIIALRAAAYLTNRNIYSPFWRAVDSISQPIMYKMNRLFFGGKIGGYLKGIILSLLFLAVLLIGGKFIIGFLVNILYSLPL